MNQSTAPITSVIINPSQLDSNLCFIGERIIESAMSWTMRESSYVTRACKAWYYIFSKNAIYARVMDYSQFHQPFFKDRVRGVYENWVASLVMEKFLPGHVESDDDELTIIVTRLTQSYYNCAVQELEPSGTAGQMGFEVRECGKLQKVQFSQMSVESFLKHSEKFNNDLQKLDDLLKQLKPWSLSSEFPSIGEVLAWFYSCFEGAETMILKNIKVCLLVLVVAYIAYLIRLCGVV